LHHLAWFRWCAARGLDPRAATATHVKAWLHALDAAGARPRTRRRMLSTLSALYGHLAESGAIAANPAALNRARLGLAASARDASPTVRLTAEQVAALLVSAARPTVRGRYAQLHATRSVAFVALLTLGLRISEITGLDRGDRYRSGGEDVLRVRGKGGLSREVYVTDIVRDALAAYLTERDRLTGTAVPVRRGRTGGGSSPLLATRVGGRCSRIDLYNRLRRIAAGPRSRARPTACIHTPSGTRTSPSPWSTTPRSRTSGPTSGTRRSPRPSTTTAACAAGTRARRTSSPKPLTYRSSALY
jgi:site-specific recombinase XerD